MAKNGKGTIIFTGATASLRGSTNFGGFAASKFALRALAQSMAREFSPKGVHVAHVIIDGEINTPGQVQSKSTHGRSQEQMLEIFLVCSGQPGRDLDSFLNSDAVRPEFFLSDADDDIPYFRLLKLTGNCIFNLERHGHMNWIFDPQLNRFKHLTLIFLQTLLTSERINTDDQIE